MEHTKTNEKPNRVNAEVDPEKSTKAIVQKRRRRIDRNENSEPEVLASWPRIGGTPPLNRHSCKRQVYATMESAENTARLLGRKTDIQGHAERCTICGLIHLREQ
jgi:hypothetical protein